MQNDFYEVARGFGKTRAVGPVLTALRSSRRYRRDARSFDEDEDMWLNEDEEEDEVSDAAPDKCKSDYGTFMESEKGGIEVFNRLSTN